MNIPPLIHLTAVIPVQVPDNRQRTGKDALASDGPARRILQNVQIQAQISDQVFVHTIRTYFVRFFKFDNGYII